MEDGSPYRNPGLVESVKAKAKLTRFIGKHRKERKKEKGEVEREFVLYGRRNIHRPVLLLRLE